MDVKELILECSGKEKNGSSKCYFNLFDELWYSDDSKEMINELFIDKPEINIFKGAGYVTVDFIYNSENDQDLYSQWKFIEDFSRPENSVDYSDEEIMTGLYLSEDDEEKPIYFPTLVVSIVPRKYNGKYSLIGISPIFTCLQPVRPGEQISMIRMVFDEEYFLFIEASEDEINIKNIENEVDEEFNNNI